MSFTAIFTLSKNRFVKSGSGKSTIGRVLAKVLPHIQHLEQDQFSGKQPAKQYANAIVRTVNAALPDDILILTKSNHTREVREHTRDVLQSGDTQCELNLVYVVLLPLHGDVSGPATATLCLDRIYHRVWHNNLDFATAQRVIPANFQHTYESLGDDELADSGVVTLDMSLSRNEMLSELLTRLATLCFISADALQTALTQVKSALAGIDKEDREAAASHGGSVLALN